MDRRIIIENRSAYDDAEVLGLVADVIRKGRISNDGKQYCYAVSFPDYGVYIVTDLNKCSDRFVILDTH